jgi:photosystem II stability/assembly factor-like uncharacterized protein
MVVATDRLLYIGTENGLFEATPRGGEYDLTPLPLKIQGTMRAPIVVDKDDPRRLYAATNKDGVLVSEDAGRSWREINRGLIYKEVWSIVQHPVTGDLYVGTCPASVFKSTDRGESWQDAEQFRTMPESIDWTFPRAPHVAHVKGLGLCDQDPDLVFGAVEEGWIVRSRDGGQTWTTIKQGTEFDSHYVTVLPHDASIVLATSGMGAYRSTDGGDSFVQITEGLDRRYFAAPVVHPERPNVMFTAAASVPPPGWRRPEGADSGYYRSEDYGETWQRVTAGLPDYFKAAPRFAGGDPLDPDVFMVGMTDGEVWASDDGAQSFHFMLSGLPSVSGVSVAARS